jgi:hypothetical protein
MSGRALHLTARRALVVAVDPGERREFCADLQEAGYDWRGDIWRGNVDENLPEDDLM